MRKDLRNRVQHKNLGERSVLRQRLVGRDPLKRFLSLECIVGEGLRRLKLLVDFSDPHPCGKTGAEKAAQVSLHCIVK